IPAAARPATLYDAAVVGASLARARMVLRTLRRRLPAAAPAVEGGRLFPRRGSGQVRGKAGQGPPVRLPHVRPVRAFLHRHVMPDELSETAPQRPLRRRARQRQLRSGAGYALRVGKSVGRLSAYASRRCDPRRAKAGRPVSARNLRLAARDGTRRRRAGAGEGRIPMTPSFCHAPLCPTGHLPHEGGDRTAAWISPTTTV